MTTETRKYKGHQIELRMPQSAEPAEPELLIDERPVPYGRLPDGSYYLPDYAFDWGTDLTKLAEHLVDYRSRVEQLRSRHNPTDRQD
jgi:hypothetical protein